ncbi:hypothetical protein H6P81_010568 [Aristolochia fimbriata]|uniref:DUF4378 domain-containing protein n=1 Tax=Aristolochia fimbriata TaxID=158543 RepID=A0AAV7ETK1_ARIFI|nr:hypothetical protein H6P81_010568 [Aristolochia fimbriata]
MSDNQQITASSLAIAEKRPQRTGGCVGIFFQLFDWNKRSAKKKLFSKKLLPPSRLKRVAKKFGGDKLPMGKLLLIADENCGGFPKKPEVDDFRCSPASGKHKGEMRTPNLVARLMGLESMPAVPHAQTEKTSFSEFQHDRETNPSGRSDFFCYEQGQNLEKGHGKLDLRPQKLQKTGFFERSSVSKFGAETLQFRTALSRSRKQHQKLLSPVKSPRNISGRNATRLMEAAAKILEPSLQASNRAKCSLTYSAPSNHYARGGDVKRGTTLSSSKPLKGQASCNSCGNLLDVVSFGSNVAEVPEFTSSGSDLSDASSHDSGRSKLNYTISSCDMGREGNNGRNGVLRTDNTTGSPAVQSQARVQSCDEQMIEKVAAREGPYQCIRPQHNVPSHMLKQSKLKQCGMNTVKGNVSTLPKMCDRQVVRRPSASDSFTSAKDYVSLNRNMNYQSRARMQVKPVDNGKYNMDRTALKKQDDSSRLNTMARKRRPVNSMQQLVKSGPHSAVVRQRSVGPCIINEKGPSMSGSLNAGVKRNLQMQAEGVKGTCSKNGDVVSFMFSSPVQPSNRSPPAASEKRKGRCGALPSAFKEKQITTDASNRKLSSIKATGQRDALGALLEQKLQELASLEADELETGSSLQGKTTAAILEELISALTMGRHTSNDNEENNFNNGSRYETPNRSDRQATSTPAIRSNSEQVNVKADASLRFSLPADCDNPSPTSILDASFSNESCLSESLDSSSGHDLQTSCSLSMDHSSCFETDTNDSATSMETQDVQIENASGNVTRILGIHPSQIGITESNCIHAREVLSNVELLFENLDQLGFAHLLDRLVTLAETQLKNDKKYLGGFMETKEENKLRRFLFDCLVECLDSMYSCYRKANLCGWGRLPLHLNLERLTRLVNEKMVQWNNLAGTILDELIEKDLRSSTPIWTDFEIEALELGYKIEGGILAALVDEVVDDLW